MGFGVYGFWDACWFLGFNLGFVSGDLRLVFSGVGIIHKFWDFVLFRVFGLGFDVVCLVRVVFVCGRGCTCWFVG